MSGKSAYNKNHTTLLFLIEMKEMATCAPISACYTIYMENKTFLIKMGSFMNISFHKKSLLLSAIFIASLAGSAIHAGFYDAASAVGHITDYIVTKGELSQENQALFEEVAKKLDIDSRNIEVRNSGLLPRLATGYNDTFYNPLTNRVYVNEAFLNTLTTEEKKCIFAQQLTHAKKNHAFKKLAQGLLLLLRKLSSVPQQ
jgi:Peptidase family M48.